MKIDLYTRSYNDAHMLPFFFRHYDALVDRYVVYDDGSTDATVRDLTAHPRVEMRPRPPYSDPDSHVRSSLELMERIWTESRGVADWVIVTDIDEHLWRPDLKAYLAAQQRLGVTLVPALGFQMLSDRFPGPDQRLCREITTGAAAPMMNKLGLFSPEAILETRFTNGRHSARPLGRVLLPAADELLLLHYKYLGREETQRRHEAYRARLRPTDLVEAWGHKYHWTREQLDRDWAELERRAVDVSAPDLDLDGLHPNRWWSGLERAEAVSGGTCSR
jgi:hypothetical protein